MAHLMEVEDQVELAHVAKVTVEHLDKVVDRLQDDELVVVVVDAGEKIERGIPAEERASAAENGWAMVRGCSTIFIRAAGVQGQGEPQAADSAETEHSRAEKE